MSNIHNEITNKSKINTDSQITQLESTQSISESATNVTESISPTQPDTSKTKRKSKPRRKELSLSDIKKKVKQINTLSEYVIDDQTKLSYYEIFDEKKIKELLLELNEHAIYDKENNIGHFKNDEEYIKYLQYLIVKYFTKLYDAVGSKFEDNRSLYDELESMGLIWLFHNHIFHQEELAKVFDRFYEYVELSEKTIELDDETKAKLENLQHKDILFNKLNKNKIIPEA